MLAIHDIPSFHDSFHEWVMLIQQNAVQARQLAIALKARNKKQGLSADASLEIRIEDRERAQRLLWMAVISLWANTRLAHNYGMDLSYVRRRDGNAIHRNRRSDPRDRPDDRR